MHVGFVDTEICLSQKELFLGWEKVMCGTAVLWDNYLDKHIDSISPEFTQPRQLTVFGVFTLLYFEKCLKMLFRMPSEDLHIAAKFDRVLSQLSESRWYSAHTAIYSYRVRLSLPSYPTRVFFLHILHFYLYSLHWGGGVGGGLLKIWGGWFPWQIFRLGTEFLMSTDANDRMNIPNFSGRVTWRPR